MRACLLLLLAAATVSTAAAESADVPPAARQLIATYCAGCHEADYAEADLNLDVATVDWTQAHVRATWAKVHDRIERGKMPPAEETPPSPEEREQLLSWIDAQLVAHDPIGGAPMRRLNRREYEQTLRQLFGMPGFELPPGFPPDSEHHGFDTVAEALVISASHLEAYAETATLLADALFPQARSKRPSEQLAFEPGDFAISYSSAAQIDGAMRLASTGQLTRNGTWLARYEIPQSARYRITIDVSAKNPPPGPPPKFALRAKRLEAKGPTRWLQAFMVTSDTPQRFEIEADLFARETLVVTYENAPLDYGNDKKLAAFLTELFAAEPALAAAWHTLSQTQRGVPRGGIGWERLKEEVAAHPDATLPANEVRQLIAKIAKNKVNTGETLVYRYFENGPNIGIHAATIEGPLELVEDDAIRSQRQLRERFLGKDFTGDDEGLARFFTRYLGQAFRRPATPREVAAYTRLVRSQQDAGRSLDEGLHLAVRTSLLSPNLLYKEHGSTDRLSAYELASRLSYFLTSAPPDATLLRAASNGSLLKPAILAKQTRRLIGSGSRTFAEDFTSQWLSTDLLDTLMPDPKLLRVYTPHYTDAMQAEVVATFEHILAGNRPLGEFINPDYVFTNPTIGWQIYGLEQFRPGKKDKPKRGRLKDVEQVGIEKGSRYGGLLGMPAVMMATANGVDTQPVLRGVWVLENIIGQAPPEPPNSVPALSPDLSGATTIKQRLAAHMADRSCASCHADIDPVGFVLENFDAIGRWRTEYPAASRKDDPLPVETDGILPEGTPLADVTDLKAWLDENPHWFATCLAEKLVIYATGRVPNYREHQIVTSIAEANIARGNRFEDLIVALVQSELFATR